ncbi:MAG TPA: peptidoglycan-associated lipoprotein Pal [Kiritimatiellae bacterium]|nr:peptidoglycan-associated lipoprotein Pal [Kiritimatiellia bacterium]
MGVGLASNGCRSQGRPGVGPQEVGGVAGAEIYGAPLADRPEGQEYQSPFQPVYFDYDSARIKVAERSKLDQVAEYLKKNPRVGLIVEGHCDERGSREYNLALGERRAQAARAYLTGVGIDPSRIQTRSYGEEKPVALGHDEESWRLNRRAEFVLFNW